MSERPSQVNDPARAQEILQPLQGTVEQAAPLVQLQEQLRAGILRPKVLPEKTLMTRVRRTARQSTLKCIFAYNVLLLYSSRGLLLIFCLPNITFSRYVFPVTGEPVLNFALGAHGRRVFFWVSHDTVLLNVWAIVCCFILCFAVALSCFLLFVFSYELGLRYIWDLFVLEDRGNYLCCLHLSLLVP